ncbi:HP0423 family protein [Helicobacter pylori]|uniref:HP0423 family protein n=1 Tax=Helicobacter pylori TaxID=210 RepID=A0A377IPE3_HELPX|nr:HP0423 family protein [Helicobacter pylori]
MVEAKVISIGFNRVTLRSEKGNEATYAFNSDKFLKWFNKVPLTEHMRLHAENKKDSTDDLLKGLKVVTSGPSVKDRTTTPKELKEKEDKFKLAFGFKDKDMTSFEIMAESYILGERKSRLGVLMSPMFFDGKGSQATAIIVTALAHAKDLNKHSDAEWLALIEDRDLSLANLESFDHMDRMSITLFCNVIREYALGGEVQDEARSLSPNGLWAEIMPKNKNEAYFVAQLLCDGGINKYNLSCAGLTENLLKDIEVNLGLATHEEVDEYFENLENEGEAENLEK